MNEMKSDQKGNLSFELCTHKKNLNKIRTLGPEILVGKMAGVTYAAFLVRSVICFYTVCNQSAMEIHKVVYCLWILAPYTI